MSDQVNEFLSKSVLRVDAATSLSEARAEIRRRRVSHVAVFSQGRCLGVSNSNMTSTGRGHETCGDLVDRQPCVSVSEAVSLEELGRLFADPAVEAHVVHNDLGEFVGVVTRQSLVEALLKERRAETRQAKMADGQDAEALLASEARNRTLLEGSPVCTKIIDLDSRLQYMSSAGQNQLKICDIEPLYGSKFPPELYPEVWRAPVAERLERAKAGETSSLECPVLDTDGNEVWYDTTFVPARDESGRILYIIVTSVNVTERRKVEDELRAIFDMSLDLICVADIDTATFVKVNPSFIRVLGYKEEELLGRTFFDFVHPDDVGATAEIVERNLKKGKEVMRFENRYRTREGDYRWLAWTANPNITSGLTYAIAHDITERKDADEQARKHRERLAHISRVNTLGEMASGLAHEINQPLTAIANFADAAEQMTSAGAPVMPDLRDLLSQIGEQSFRAGEIIRRLRSLVDRGEPKRSPTNIAEVVSGVLGLVEYEVHLYSVRMNLELDDTLPPIMADQIQLHQVMLNLVRNAIDAVTEQNDRPRELTIKACVHDEQSVEVLVQDNGVGFSSGNLETIFDAFESSKPDGLGMGLAISRTIVEAHEGRIWAAQVQPFGAAFRVWLPVNPGEPIGRLDQERRAATPGTDD